VSGVVRPPVRIKERYAALAKVDQIHEDLKEALLTIIAYVKETTGEEPSQEEIAHCLKSYFIRNEILNQIRFQRKKPPPERPPRFKAPFWRFNMMAPVKKNFLARAGIYKDCVKEAIWMAQNFIAETTGQESNPTELANSLKSSFILSEIKNQVVHQRRRLRAAAKKT
jgi:hypothetical protein